MESLSCISLIAKLVVNNMLRCLSCGSNSFSNFLDGLLCNNCHALYPKRNGVVDFFNQYIKDDRKASCKVSKKVIRAIIQKLSLPNTDDMSSKVEDILKRTFLKAEQNHLNSEIKDIFDRFGIHTNRFLPKVEFKIREMKSNRDFKIIYEKHYIETSLPASSTIYRNLRITNSGNYRWSSRAKKPLVLSYRWVSDRNDVVYGGAIKFPIDIKSGRTITLPLKIDTPLTAGRYKLQIALVLGDQEWIDDSLLNIDVTVGHIGENRYYKLFHFTNKSYTYEEDHKVGTKLLSVYLQNTYGNDCSKLLELGGGVFPQSAFLKYSNYELINTDVSSALLELGSFYFSHHHPERKDLCFICCEASNLPFVDNLFDGVVIFSTLHHIPEPISFLKKLQMVLKEDGFVAIMCEPVGNNLTFAIRDLEKGINEQIFSLEEYSFIFESAGLIPIFGQIDGGSLKAILEKKSDSKSTHHTLKVKAENFEQFLREQYMELLKREPDGEGFSFFLSKLRKLELSKREVIEIIKDSEEYRSIKCGC